MKNNCITTYTAMALMAVCCGPRGPVEGPKTDGAASDGEPVSGLVQGKKPASFIATPEGVLVTRVDEDQLEMAYTHEGAFGAGERLRKAMEGSETAFVHEPIGAGPSTFHDLFAGLRQPDPFLVVEQKGDVHIGKIYQADPAILADVQTLMEKMEKAPDQLHGLCAEWEALIERDPAMPLLHDQLAGCYQAKGDMAKALASLEEEIEINPAHAAAQLGVAAALAGKDTQLEAREHVILALFYYPAFAQAREWINTSGVLAGTSARVEYFAPRIDVGVSAEGLVVIRAPTNQPWLDDYATCKAGFRYAPEVRMTFGMKAEAYKPSLLEEMICLGLASQGYARDREAGQPAEVMGDILMKALSERRLLEAAFFEVIGFHDPDMMKLLPEEMRVQVIAWIEDTVLLEKIPATE